MLAPLSSSPATTAPFRPTLPARVRLPVRREPHRLDPALPIHAIPWVHPDAPITALHAHDALELGVCIDGAGEYRIEDETSAYRTGSLVVIAPGHGHYSRSAAGTVSRWMYVFVDPRLLGVPPTSLGAVLSPSAAPRLGEVLRLLGDELAAGARRDAARALALAALAMLPQTGDPKRVARTEARARVQPALDHLRRRLADPTDASALAAACGLPVRTFTRLFRVATGQSPHAFILRARVAEACARLDDPRARVLDVALDCGFESLSAFNRQFRSITGASPSAFRRAAWR